MDRISQLAALGLFDAKVPRYTSYPTAPHFSEGVGSNQTREWISRIAPGSEISLYVHVPFCRTLCWFCACRTQGTRTGAPVAGYLDRLVRELSLISEVLPKDVRLGRLHWGGGTPTILSPSQISALARAIFEVTPLAEGAEFSVEIDPNEIDRNRADALAEAGMTRASIGVQDFDPDIQQRIGRMQSYEITAKAVDLVRASGVTSVNTDLLYGLPGQSRTKITASVQKLLSLTPDRIALYGYAHVPWMAKRQQLIETDLLPDPPQRLELFETARDLFAWDGYTEIGIDHFARPTDNLARAAQTGKLRRNFQGYTDDASPVLLGLGASSISRFPQGYAQNAAATSEYARRVDAGTFATARGHVFRGDDRLRARLIEALMCDFAVNVDAVADETGFAASAVKRRLQQAATSFDGFVAWQKGRFAVLPEGRPLTRMIASSLDTYDSEKAKHSAAI